MEIAQKLGSNIDNFKTVFLKFPLLVKRFCGLNDLFYFNAKYFCNYNY